MERNYYWILEEDQLICIYTHRIHAHKCQVITPNFLHKFHYSKVAVCPFFQRHFVALCVRGHFSGRQNVPLIPFRNVPLWLAHKVVC